MFNPNQHLMQIKNKQGSSDYLPVQWRIVWFRQDCPQGTISTEMLFFDPDKETQEEVSVWSKEKNRSEKIIKSANGLAVFRATVSDGQGKVAMGTKMEKAASFPDYLEKAETGAIGRALAALGFGTQFAPELEEEHRLADAPVERPLPPRPQAQPAFRKEEPTETVEQVDPHLDINYLFAQGRAKNLWKTAGQMLDWIGTNLGLSVSSESIKQWSEGDRIMLQVAIEQASADTGALELAREEVSA